MHVEPAPSAVGPSPVAQSPVALSARGLHDLACEAFRIGNRGRLSLCEALRVLDETRLYFDLGFPSLAAYAETHFQLRRAETYEHVRVAKALVELTELREAFSQGRLSWSILKAITRVASPASQSTWIAFAQRHAVEQTLAEAQVALRLRRDTPRDAGFGLPNLDQRLVLRFSRSDMNKVRSWIERTCATISERTGLEDVSVEQALLFLSESGLVSDFGGVGASAPDAPAESGGASQDTASDAIGPHGARSHRASAYAAQIVYQRCPDCRRSRMGTPEGQVEITPEELERHDGCAEPVTIDGPTPPALRRRILAREGGRCGNPRCHHQARHGHHIVFRSRGGKTELANEVAVCTTCHALIHAGLLRVRGRADDELQWTPAPVDTCAPPSTLDSTETGPESVTADCAAHGVAGVDDLAHGLSRLGLPVKRSRELIGAAIEALPRGERTEAAILRRALATL